MLNDSHYYRYQVAIARKSYDIMWNKDRAYYFSRTFRPTLGPNENTNYISIVKEELNMSWSKNNAAHRYLWIFVRSIHWDFANEGVAMTTFEEGGEWETRFIISAAVGDTPEMMESKAKIFAIKFNKWIIVQKDAHFENGYNTSTAITGLTDAFKTPAAVLKDCADLVDEIYLCKGEIA